MELFLNSNRMSRLKNFHDLFEIKFKGIQWNSNRSDLRLIANCYFD